MFPSADVHDLASVNPCDVERILDSCTLGTGYVQFEKKVYQGLLWKGIVFYFRRGVPQPSAANAFALIVRGQQHINDCSPEATSRRGIRISAISLQQLTQCTLDRFQADGPAGFAAGAFTVDTVVVVPAGAVKLAAPKGMALKWE